MPEPDTIPVKIVLLAAGRGERLGGETPKQYLPLGGRPLLLHSLERLAALPGVREIVIVSPGGKLPSEIQLRVNSFVSSYPGLALKSAAGGGRRQDSVAAGLDVIHQDNNGPNASGVVLVHDSARPFVPRQETIELITKAEATGGAILAVPATDTVKESDEEGLIKATLDRNRIWLAQTPQAFRVELFTELIETLVGAAEFTDESAALEAIGVPVALVAGTPSNFKVTSRQDFLRAERKLEERDV